LKNSAVAGGRVKIVPIRSSPQVSIAMGQYSFFDHENRLHSISKLGDPLERLVAAIPWEIYASVWRFRERLKELG